MARNTRTFIADAGRDAGKHFLITEMSAFAAESWATRAILALMAGSVEVPEDWQNMSMAAMAEIGIKALSRLKYADAQPLLAEMLDCVELVPDPAKPAMKLRVNDFPDQIEEMGTILQLRAEVWKLHVDFFKVAAPSLFAAAAA